MTEEERDPELVRLRSKLADAISDLAFIHRTVGDYGELSKDLKLSSGDWFCAEAAVRNLNKIVYIMDNYAKEEKN